MIEYVHGEEVLQIKKLFTWGSITDLCTTARLGRAPERTAEITGSTVRQQALISSLIRSGHGSIFEFAGAAFEVTVPVYVATQITRHRSMSFMQQSFRLPTPDHRIWSLEYDPELQSLTEALNSTREAKNLRGESLRNLLPASTLTTLRMSGNLRAWFRYLNLRAPHTGTQLEHKLLAQKLLTALEDDPWCAPVMTAWKIQGSPII